MAGKATKSEAREWRLIHQGFRKRKLIKARCDNCGLERIIRKDAYHALCGSCSQRKRKRSAAKIGKKHPRWTGIWTDKFIKAYNKIYREGHREEIAELQRNYYRNHRKEILKSVSLYQKTPNGRKTTHKQGAKRRRELGYTLLLPLVEGEVGHHVTNKYVIGIPEDIHMRFSGYKRKKHRALILEWLKVNDRKKYEMVLDVIWN